MLWKDFESSFRHLPVHEQERVHKAFDLCVTSHEGQLRKSGEPYSTHPIAVALGIAKLEADADSLVSALLHDAIEDTALTLSAVQEQFGPNAASIVDAVTKLDDEAIRAHPTLDEEIESLRKIFTFMEKDVRIMVIKLFDRLHNMQTIQFLSLERQKTFSQETLDVYVKIADRLSMQDLSNLLEYLCIAVLDPQLSEKLKELRDANEVKGREVIRAMTDVLQHNHFSLPRNSEMLFEYKSWTHLRARAGTEEAAVSGRSDVTIALLCETISECYQILGVLHQKWPHEILSFKDFINAPAINGYRGLHSTIILQDGTRVRCKIRTQEMHAYAHKGVTTTCFKEGSRGRAAALPWTERISPLAKDTADRSKEFWDSLQSDILEHSILIYGADDTALQLPAGSTALDGAIYLYRGNALHLTSISVNGKPVPYFSPLAAGISLEIEVGSRKRTISREWLKWVNTGLALAYIREALGTKSEELKIAEGKQLLEEAMIQQSRGYISEFREADILRGIKTLGYSSLPQAYTAIAEGHLNPEIAISVIFQPKKKDVASATAAQPCTISFMIKADSIAEVERYLPIEKKYHISIGDIQVFRSPEKRSRVSLQCNLSPKEQQLIVAELQAAGAQDISIGRLKFQIKNIFVVILIFALWGIDPVLAHLLLNTYSVQALDLTVVRFFSLLAMSSILLVWTNTRLPLRQAVLPLRNKSLWISVIALFVVAFSTYLSLEHTLPSHYTIPMTASGFMLTSLVNRKRWRILLASWVLFLLGFALLVSLSLAYWSLKSILFTMTAVIAFTVFSVASERYKRFEQVDARAAQYFFVLSSFCTVLTLPFLPLAQILNYPVLVDLLMILFSIFFAGLPYYIYYYVLSHREIDFVLRYSFLLIPTTIIGQLLFIRSAPLATLLLPALIVTISAALPLLTKKDESTLQV